MDNSTINYSKLDHPGILPFVFYPRKETVSHPPPGALTYEVPVAEGVQIGCRFYLADSAAAHILFFHGNGEIVSDYDDLGPVYNSYGLNLLAVDYRGYGASSGSPTMTAMIQDAHVIYKNITAWLQEQGRTGPLFVMGRSLGSASALELAASYAAEVAGLIIESGFAYTVPLLNFLGADTAASGITESDGLRHVEKIALFGKPTLIIHAQFDQFIPLSDAETLLESCPSQQKEFMMVRGADHNSILMMAGKNYFEKIRSFTVKVGA